MKDSSTFNYSHKVSHYVSSKRGLTNSGLFTEENRDRGTRIYTNDQIDVFLCVKPLFFFSIYLKRSNRNLDRKCGDTSRDGPTRYTSIFVVYLFVKTPRKTTKT